MHIIEVNNLKKNYGTKEAVKGINFSVEAESFFAFLGENGAGKSTTINIISTLLRKSSGQVIINNHKLDKEDQEIRDSIGIVFQNNMLDKFLTVRENLISRGRMYGLNKYQLEEGFLPNYFIRINKSEIVNIKKIKNISPMFKGNLLIYLEGYKPPFDISRNYTKSFKERLGIK